MLGCLDQHIGQVIRALDQLVVTRDAGKQGNLIHAAAMKAAACSCFTSTERMGESKSASYAGKLCEPGMPKIHFTPKFSRYLTRSSLTAMFIGALVTNAKNENKAEG